MPRAVPAELPPRDADVEHEQEQIATGIESTASEWRVGSPCQLGNRGHEETDGRDEDQREPDEARLPVETHVAGADEEREAEDEQDVADDAPRQRAAHDLGQARC